jgi:hypothetical protein
MEKISDPNLKAYIVWLPVLPFRAHESAARREAGRIPDRRAVGFYDPDTHLGKLYSAILHLPRGLPAWDVYLVFGPEVRWEQSPPAPTYWMHQLGRVGPRELLLDAEQMRQVISGLLRSPRPMAVLPDFGAPYQPDAATAPFPVRQGRSGTQAAPAGERYRSPTFAIRLRQTRRLEFDAVRRHRQRS